MLQKILQGCHNKAQILGYPNYAALDLEGHLALRGLSNVTDFIDNVVAMVKPQAHQEKQAMSQVFGTKDLKVWQADFAKEVLLQKMFSGFDSSHIRPYLQVGNVLPQITMLIQELFGVQFKHQPEVKSWVDTGVSCYDVYDVDEGRIMGGSTQMQVQYPSHQEAPLILSGSNMFFSFIHGTTNTVTCVSVS